MFNNYGPRQNPRYVTGTIITQALERETSSSAQLEPLRDFCFCTDGVRGHLTVAAHGIPGDVYVYGQGENISMRDWAEMILRVGEEQGYWPSARDRHQRRALPARRERGDGAARRLREAEPRDRLGAEGLVGGRRRQTIALVRREPRPLDRPRRLARRATRRRQAMKILVTGGGGFLGSHLVERLRPRRRAVFVARRADYDLTRADDAARLFADARAGARLPPRRRGRRHRRQPREPGPLLVREPADGRARARAGAAARRRASSSLAGTVCAYPKFTPVPFREDDLWNGYPEETNAPYGVAKKSMLVGAQAYREQYGLNAIFLLPANLYGPRDNFDLENAHVIPALIRKMLDGDRRGRALGRRLADARVPLRRGLRRRASCSRPSATTAPSRSTSARARRSRSASSPSSSPSVDRLRAARSRGTRRCRTASRGAALDASRAQELFGFEARTPLREGLERTVAWYREHAGAAAPA